MKKLLVFAFFALPALAAENVTYIRASRLIDGRGGAIVSPATITVQGNKIVAVGSKAPDGANVIDLGDVTLLPGLIDAHVHLLLQGDVTTEDYDEQIFKESMPYRALRASGAGKSALPPSLTTTPEPKNPGAREP